MRSRFPDVGDADDQSVSDESCEPLTGIVLAAVPDRQQPEAAAVQPAIASPEHSLNVVQLLREMRHFHDSIALMIRSSFLSLRSPNKASRRPVARSSSSIVALRASKRYRCGSMLSRA